MNGVIGGGQLGYNFRRLIRRLKLLLLRILVALGGAVQVKAA